MTPKEKAQELVLNYCREGQRDTIMKFDDAKLCVLIAINEIMNLKTFKSTPQICVEHLNYWDKVKKEIENL